MANQFVEELKNLGEVEEWYWDGLSWEDLSWGCQGLRAMQYKCYRTKYANGYGASIVKHPGSYGFEDDLWELAVIKWENDDCHLTYDTSITQDVEGYLTDGDVLELCKRIKSLNEKRERRGGREQCK